MTKKLAADDINLPSDHSAVVFAPDGSMSLILPKHSDDSEIEVDSPTFRAAVAGSLFTEPNRDISEQLVERFLGYKP